MEQTNREAKAPQYLTCERRNIFELLMLAAGMMGAYTFNLRGGVFCNAQTANIVMMAIAFGKGSFREGLYFLIPITAYLGGAFLSELLPKPVKKMGFLRWDTYLVGVEILVLFGIGWIPLSVTDHVVQVMINFICSMQYNTFRQAEGVPMATTFCTNHVRQVGVGLANFIRKKDRTVLKRVLLHTRMLLSFFAGGAVLTLFCAPLQEKAIWIAVLPLLVIFVLLVYADLVPEHRLLGKKPAGH